MTDTASTDAAPETPSAAAPASAPIAEASANAIATTGFPADTDSIRAMIHTVRGRQVMLDSDLAALYQVETKNLNKAAKRNEARFPDDFRFQITQDELEILRFQIGTSCADLRKFGGGRRYLPYVYSEPGVAMLSGILRSDVAVRTSIEIMRAFVEMRRMLAGGTGLIDRIREIDRRQIIDQQHNDERFAKVFALLEEPPARPEAIFLEGQVYDAFSLLADIIGTAEREVALVDPYVDVQTLNLLAKKQPGVRAIVHTRNDGRLSSDDVETFNAQYPTLEVRRTSTFHDRFLVLDGESVYHVGASLKDAGRKCFALSRLEDPALTSALLTQISPEESPSP